MSKDGGPDCGTCGGTGRIYEARSMFPADGYARTLCGICGGTGHSRYRDEPEYVRWQAACRTMLATRTEGEG